MPMGKPADDIASGTDMEGWPVMLAIWVKGEKTAARWPHAPAIPCCVAGQELVLLRLPATAVAMPAGTAKITFTSGTTGTPKGVCLGAAAMDRVAEGLVQALAPLDIRRHLCALPGIEALNPPGGIGYHHLLFDRHEIVRSNGAWTESLFTGPQALASLGPAARREIRAIFPELFGQNAPGWQGARDFLTGAQTRELTRRHLKNDKPLIA